MKKHLIILSIAFFAVSAFVVLRTTPAQSAPHNGISYASDVRPILESRCGSCHMGLFVSAGLHMDTYASLMAGSEHGPVIVPGKANDSLLIKKLLEGKMPKRGPKLTPAQIQVIVDWINAGALDN